HRFAFHPFCSKRTGCNSGSTTKCFKLRINYLPIIINFQDQSYTYTKLYLQLHDITTCRGSYKTSSNIFIIFIKRSNISGIFVMINHL
ncbi:hypothetical protein EGW08_001613, partial [Elysia chlorotica]